MSTFEKNMAEIFDVEPIEVKPKPVAKQEVVPTVVQDVQETDALEKDLQTDYNKVRRNYEEIIEKGVDAIDSILEIARESEHPRAFEVAATMIKNVTDANEKLIILQKQMREMNKNQQRETNKTTIDKAIFVGSTSELNKYLKGRE